MYSNVSLRTERDKMGRTVKREYTFDSQCEITAYSYNNHGDLIKQIMLRNNKILFEYRYYYMYDEYNNKVLRTGVSNTTQNDESGIIISCYKYKNEYLDNRLSKKSLFDIHDKQLYENLYFYDKDKLVRTEKYNGRDKLELWRREQYLYSGDTAEKTVLLSDGTLSHYEILNFDKDKITSKRLMSPVKGIYRWEITDSGNGTYSIHAQEDLLTADILTEILNHINSIKQDKNISVFIEASDTLVDITDNKLPIIEKHFNEQGIIINYMP